VWEKVGKRNVPFQATLEESTLQLRQRRLKAKPVDRVDATSAWITGSEKILTSLQKVLGKSDYRAFAGAYSGGANAVYWLRLLRQNADGTVRVHNIMEGARREIADNDYDIEPDLLFPLLRGREVKKWQVCPDDVARFLIVQDIERRRGLRETEMEQWPRTRSYLEK